MEWGGVECEREEEQGRENRITRAHRFGFGWRCHVDCKFRACLKIKEERSVVELGRNECYSVLSSFPLFLAMLSILLLSLIILCYSNTTHSLVFALRITCPLACCVP